MVAGVHEGAAGALGVEIGIVEGRAGLVGGEAAGEQGIGLEFGRAAVELAGMALHHSRAPVHGLYDAAHLHIHVAVLGELADQVAVFPLADDGKGAGVVGGLWRADIEEAGAVGKLDDVVDVSGDADVFVDQPRSLVCGHARLRPGRKGRDNRGQSAKQEPM